MKKPIVHAYFLCYNESNILPHLIRYYSKFCEKIFILDNQSNDNSREIVESFDNTEFSTFDTNEKFNDNINIFIKNNIWKKSRGHADYVILGDTDEFLYHENMIEFLNESYNNGITFFKTEGYHMIADEEFNLLYDQNILELVKDGVRSTVLDKPMMFDCNEIKEIDYSVGAHDANPNGNVKMFSDPSLKMLHYKFLGLDDYILKNKIRSERLSKSNIKNNLGTYYLSSVDEIILDYKSYVSRRVKILD